jgi:vacuolar-type H+-ATPase subunit I/STV1
MYKETRIFLWQILRQKAIWKDGELWTSLVVAAAACWWFHRSPDAIDGLKQQLSDILTISSIVFGFVMTTLALFAEVTTGWSKEPKVKRVVGKIFDWQTWSVLCLMLQMAYIVAIRLADGRINLGLNCRPLWFAMLVFATIYAGCQVWNHTLTIWWAFRDPSKLEPPEKANDDAEHHYADQSH